MHMDRDFWTGEVEEMEARLGFEEGYKLVFGPWETLYGAEVAFLSSHPSPEPGGTKQRIICEKEKNSYELDKETNKSRITAQFLGLAKLIKRQPIEILTGVAIPFRVGSWDSLTDIQKSESLRLGEAFWQEPLRQKSLQLIIACGKVAESSVVKIIGAELDHKMPSGYGTTELRRYYHKGDDKTIIYLPLSTKRLPLSGLEGKPEVIKIFGEFVGGRKP